MNLRFAAYAAIVVACVIGTIVVPLRLHDHEKSVAEDARGDLSREAATQVEEIVAKTTQGMQSIAGLFDASQAVEPEEFNDFTRHLIAQRAVSSFVFLEAVNGDERADWEERLDAEITDITPDGLRPAIQRARYYPVTLIQTKANQRTFGPDLGSNPIRRQAIERAIATGEPQITPPIQLVTGLTGLVLFAPVYADPGVPATVAERRRNLEGLVVGVYRATTLTESLERRIGRAKVVEITDKGQAVTETGQLARDSDAVSVEVPVAGRTWTVRSGPNPTTNMIPTIAAAIAGLVITLGALVAIIGAARRERYAERQVARRMRERDRARAERASTEQRYRTVVAAMSDGVVVHDMAGSVVDSNAAAREILGLSKEEMRGREQDVRTEIVVLDETGNEVSRDDLPFARVLREGVAQPPTVMGIAGGGRDTRWVSVSAEPIFDPASNDQRAVVSCFSDVTEQIKSGRRIRRERDHSHALVEAMQDGVLHLDAAGIITQASSRFCEMTGFPTEQLVGAGPPYPFWPENDRRLADLITDLSRGRAREIDAVFRHADDESLPVIIAGSPMRDGDGANLGAVLTIKDATERDKARRAKDEFVSVVSHELRTPLTSIHGALDMLNHGKADQLDDTGRRVLDIAYRNTERLSHLINHVLDLEQINAGEKGDDFAAVNGGVLLAQAANLLDPLAHENSISLEIVPPNDDLGVYCDSDRITQVLTNFLSNAIKFSPAGSSVTLSCWREDDEVHFRVRDRGRGIPDDQLKAIFERFHQVDSSDRRNVEGAGLGLAISHQIAELHDGRVWAESTMGEGSTFILALPASSEQPGASDPRPEAAEVAPA